MVLESYVEFGIWNFIYPMADPGFVSWGFLSFGMRGGAFDISDKDSSEQIGNKWCFITTVD